MSSVEKLYSTNYVDNVFTYIGYNYKRQEASRAHLALYGINELSKSNRLILCRRQIANRDVRIVIETPNSRRHSRFEVDAMRDRNYEKFLYNFNQLSNACYLTALQADESTWNLQKVPLSLAKDTNFYVIQSSPTINERQLKRTLGDKEFLASYSEKLDKLQLDVSNSLCKNLNSHQKHVNSEFGVLSTDVSGEKDIHVFRSFRILGLRHRINKFESIESNLRVDPFSEIIEIRCAFDIRQFSSRNAYDCFVECEISYYKMASDDFTTAELKWFNYLNCFDDVVVRDKRRTKDRESKLFDRYGNGNLDKIEENYENYNCNANYHFNEYFDN